MQNEVNLNILCVVYFNSYTVPPQVTSNMSTVVAKKGDLVSLYCQAVGIPAPVIDWFKGRDEVRHTNSWAVPSVGGRIITLSAVSLVNVEVAGAGEYVCRATNKGGRSNTTVSLDVQCESFGTRD